MKARVTVSSPRAFEDFAVGLRFQSPRGVTITAERIQSFAAEFDPQAPHLNEAVARGTFFRGLVASGWHTAAVAMRLLVDSNLGLDGQGAGVAVESMRWRRPVRAGDTLRVAGTVIQARPSRSRPQAGLVTFALTVFNQHDQAVLEATHVVLVPRRSGAPAPQEP